MTPTDMSSRVKEWCCLPSCLPLCAVGLAAGCAPGQSALHPAGREAEEVARLFWIMAGAGAVIWVIVMGTALYAVLGRHRPTSDRFADRFILIGGVAFPTVMLAGLLMVGLRILPDWTAQDAPGLRVRVHAEQFWWRITYDLPDGREVETANEIHLPAGIEVEFVITSPDVIHSFWIPALGGKMDAIPGRTNVLRLTPTTPGQYRGVCAEYCGLSHALMAFAVQVHTPDDFASWIGQQAAPASGPAAPFVQAGCAACHTIRGVVGQSRIGPDLTHLASRRTIGAGILPMNAQAMRTWLTATEDIKPDVHMPAYDMLPEPEIAALVDALMGLR